MSYEYVANGQRVVLEVDEDLIAVRFAEPAEQSTRAALADLADLAPYSERVEIPEEKFTILPIAEVAKPRHERYMAAAGQLSQEDEVVRVAPVFKIGDAQAIATDRLLIGLKARGKKARKYLNSLGFTVLEEFGDGTEFLVRLAPQADPFAMIAELAAASDISYVEPDFVIMGKHTTRLAAPAVNGGDPLLSEQYAPQITKAVDAWAVQQGDPAIKIAILDEGMDTEHEDLAAAIVGGYDATDDDEFQDPMDWDAHGTACAGLAAAIPNNDRGVRGIGGGCSLLAVRIAYSPSPGANWVTNSNWIRRGIDWAWKNHADVLSNSWGGGAPSSTITQAFERARNQGRDGKGCIVVIAAGNDSGPVSFPGTLADLLTVSASNEFDEFKSRTSRDGEGWWGSNQGPEVDVAAPGVHNYTTDITGSDGYNPAPDGDYYPIFNGTSSATPIVAGAVGLLLSANPTLGEAAVRQIIRNTADKVGGLHYFQGRNDQMGYGRLNVERAVKEARRSVNGNGAHTPDKSPATQTMDMSDQAFHDFLEQIEALTQDERELLVDQALKLIDNYYVHLPLKRAMYAIDPVQRLKLLRNRLADISDRRFHSELLSIFNDLRDLHTNYLLPEPYNSMGAVLPFLIEEFYENGERFFIVSKVDDEFLHPTFGPGVTITHWNGIPIDRAIAINADRNAGSNEDARFARGLEGMTIRPLIMTLPPEEEWVDVRYKRGGAVHGLRFNWRGLPLPKAGEDELEADGQLGMTSLGIDVHGEASRLLKKALFAPAAIAVEEQVALYQAGEISGEAAPDLAGVSLMPDNFKFRVVDTNHGQLGYIRIYSFSRRTNRSSFVEEFVQEFRRILDLMPVTGLIIDVRGNGGGFIQAGERILQFLSDGPVQPEMFHFINDYATKQLCGRVSRLNSWHESISLSLQTGAVYSQGFTLTPHAEANGIGRLYHAPVVLITDALCYSTTDIFAAGFQDHNIGPILGIHGNTGAGGANVWRHKNLLDYVGEEGGIEPLPRKANFRVSIRQCTRVGRRAGLPVEDLGVVPDKRHHMTRRDLLEDNVDLIEAAAGLLFAG